MKSRPAPFSVAKSHEAIYVRVIGLGSMVNASTLEAFALKAVEEGASQFVLDLKECSGVDSTFMGMLLALSNQLTELDAECAGVVLINVDEHAHKQLSSVGLDAFLTIKNGKTRLPSRLRLTDLDVVEASDRERLKLMVRAHKELVAADARNKAKFGAFLEAIVAELE